MASLPAELHHESPSQDHLFTDRQNPIGEPRADLVLQPADQFESLCGVSCTFDSEPDFGECDTAHEQFRGRLQSEKCHHVFVGLWPPLLRYDVCVQQPTAHSSTSRTVNLYVGRSIIRSHSSGLTGHFCIASIKSCPVGSPVSRRYSLADMTTTSSRPRTVTCWGPWLFALRTNSLKRALASCNDQWPGNGTARLARGRADEAAGAVLAADEDFRVILTRLTCQGRQFNASCKPFSPGSGRRGSAALALFRGGPGPADRGVRVRCRRGASGPVRGRRSAP
jgi:hypothetical protein